MGLRNEIHIGFFDWARKRDIHVCITRSLQLGHNYPVYGTEIFHVSLFKPFHTREPATSVRPEGPLSEGATLLYEECQLHRHCLAG